MAGIIDHKINDAVDTGADFGGKYNDLITALLTAFDIAGGVATFSSIPVLPASDPTEDNQAVRKKYHDDDISEKFDTSTGHDHDGTNSKKISGNQLGTWAEKSNNTVYQATTDGFVTAWATPGAYGSWVYGYTDANNPPTTKRAQCAGGSESAGTALGITMPVKKGDYWKVTGANIVCWIPFGL